MAAGRQLACLVTLQSKSTLLGGSTGRHGLTAGLGKPLRCNHVCTNTIRRGAPRFLPKAKYRPVRPPSNESFDRSFTRRGKISPGAPAKKRIPRPKCTGKAKYRPVRPPGNASSDNSGGTTHEGRPDPGRPESSFWISFIKSAKIRKKPNGSF